jgi:hypothetical protein
LKAVAKPGDSAKLVGGSKIVEHDPVHAMLYSWEIAYQKREAERAANRNNGGGNGQDWK